jgi:hypothetical protein
MFQSRSVFLDWFVYDTNDELDAATLEYIQDFYKLSRRDNGTCVRVRRFLC